MKKTATFVLNQRLIMSDFSNEIFLFPDTFERPFIRFLKRRKLNNYLGPRNMNCYFIHLTNDATARKQPKEPYRHLNDGCTL